MIHKTVCNLKEFSKYTLWYSLTVNQVDGSGKLSFNEFQFLWHHLRSWKVCIDSLKLGKKKF